MRHKVKNKLFVEILDQQTTEFDKMYNSTLNEVFLKLREKMYELQSHTQVYGFTLTLKKKFHEDDDRWLHNHIGEKIAKQKHWKDKKYIMFPEYTKNGVLHYHGVMWDCYEYSFMNSIKYWRSTFGFAKPELEIKHYIKWIEYITKNHGKAGLWTLYKIL